MTRSTWWSALARSMKVTTRPVLQIAADGCWERARVVEAADLSTTGPTAVREVASAARRDVAVEVLWPGQAFVGVRWPAAQADEAAAAASRTDGVLSRQGGVAAPSIIEAALVALLGATPSPDLERAELGAVNAWASVGPEVLWRNGDAWTPQDLDALVAGRPDLCVCARPVAVELVVSRPRACWVGVVVSNGPGPDHHLDRQALDAVLRRSIWGRSRA
jgi:hypothetical protein